ncbi:MAG: cytochrome c3 family protein [Bacteroidota bacterium]
MKNVQKLFYFAGLMIAVGCLMITSCTKEGPQGPAGTNGVNGLNGVNGTNGLNGKDATGSCLVCHTVANFDAKIAEYHLSKHYLGTTSNRFGKFCAGCHTSEGFLQNLGSGKFIVSNDMPASNRVNCTTCHKHSGFDFSGDTVSQILTTTSSVFLNYNKNLTATDFGAINNLCVTCHQIRGYTSLTYFDVAQNKSVPFDQLPYFPFVNTDDNAEVEYRVGRSFAVHDGNQSNLFSGINGYEYAGKTYTRVWKHSDYSCTDCHMNKFDAATGTGGHTMWVNKAECTACHGGSDKIAPIQALIELKRIELAELLTTKKIFRKTVNATTGAISYSAMPTHDFFGVQFATVQDTTKYAIALASANTVDPKTGLVVYTNNVTIGVDPNYAYRIGRKWKYGELGAAYNYGYINSELSKGAHNPPYALQILQNSIDWVAAN